MSDDPRPVLTEPSESLEAQGLSSQFSVRAWWPVGLLAAGVIVLYAQVIAGLFSQWYDNPEYSHGFLVPLVSAYVIWMNRERLRSIEPRPATFMGVAVIVGALMLLFLGSLGAELFLTRISLLGTITGLVIYFGGWHLVRALTFPLAFLLLAIPLPALIYNEIVFPLQLLASRLATGCLDISHSMPVLREGNVLILPNSTLEVVEACSGIRSLMSLITLAAGYAYLVEKNLTIRTLVVIGMIPVAIIANSSRVMITALVTYYMSPAAAEGITHALSGLAIFVAATFLMISLHAVLRKMWTRFAWGRA